MEKEFKQWFNANALRFAHGQFSDESIAYSAWLEGKKQALRQQPVVGRSERLICECDEPSPNDRGFNWCNNCNRFLKHQ